MTGADLLVEELQARGVPFVATLNGHGLDPFYLACQRAGMRMVDVRNEQSASYMAEVTGRLTRCVGVCAVSGGVAHANALTGVVNAWFDGAPMLLITGTTPLAELGWGNFQDFNPVPLAAPICKFSRLLDVPQRIPQIVHEAFTAATSGRPGPVHLALPMDVASAEVESAAAPRSAIRTGEVRIDGAATPDAIDALARLVKQSVRPLLIAGSGVYYSRGESALAQFARQQHVPVVVPIWDRGSVAQSLEEFVGVIGAASGGATLLPDADLVLAVGTECDYRVGQLRPPGVHPHARTVHIHADSARLRSGLEAQLSIAGSPAVVLQQLADACLQAGCNATAGWLQEAQARRTAHRQHCLDKAARVAGLNGCDVVRAVQESLGDDAILLIDGGNIGQWFHQLLTDRYPAHWVTCGASGVVGFGLPGAMAAKALYPDRPLVLLSGDGSFTFTLAELECAARQGLHFVAVIADDQQWGITVTGHLKKHGQPLYSLLGPTRLDRVAESLGCRGVWIDDRQALASAIRSALTTEAVTVIQVPIIPSSPAD